MDTAEPVIATAGSCASRVSLADILLLPAGDGACPPFAVMYRRWPGLSLVAVALRDGRMLIATRDGLLITLLPTQAAPAAVLADVRRVYWWWAQTSCYSPAALLPRLLGTGGPITVDWWDLGAWLARQTSQTTVKLRSA